MGTLGDLLYADSAKIRVDEAEWAALVRAMVAGDQRALQSLYERTHRLVFTLCLRICGSRETAEELTVDVFHDAWRKAPTYDPDVGTVIAWIMNQARSRAIDRLRFEQRKKRSAQMQDELLLDVFEVDSADMLELADSGRRLRDAMHVLNAEEHTAIETTYFSDLSYAEAAEQLAVPLGTVKTRIRSALAKLRRELAAGQGNP